VNIVLGNLQSTHDEMNEMGTCGFTHLLILLGWRHLFSKAGLIAQKCL